MNKTPITDKYHEQDPEGHDPDRRVWSESETRPQTAEEIERDKNPNRIVRGLFRPCVNHNPDCLGACPACLAALTAAGADTAPEPATAIDPRGVQNHLFMIESLQNPTDLHAACKAILANWDSGDLDFAVQGLQRIMLQDGAPVGHFAFADSGYALDGRVYAISREIGPPNLVPEDPNDPNRFEINVRLFCYECGHIIGEYDSVFDREAQEREAALTREEADAALVAALTQIRLHDAMEEFFDDLCCPNCKLDETDRVTLTGAAEGSE